MWVLWLAPFLTPLSLPCCYHTFCWQHHCLKVAQCSHCRINFIFMSWGFKNCISVNVHHSEQVKNAELKVQNEKAERWGLSRTLHKVVDQPLVKWFRIHHLNYSVTHAVSIFNECLSSPTLKNSFVEPESRVPYAISVCLARSSALSIGETILSTVKKAARLAV